jgi:hypothetical protein
LTSCSTPIFGQELHFHAIHQNEQYFVSKVLPKYIILNYFCIITAVNKANEIACLHRQLKDSDAKQKRQSSTITNKMDHLQKSLNNALDEITTLTAEKEEIVKAHARDCEKMHVQLRAL